MNNNKTAKKVPLGALSAGLAEFRLRYTTSFRFPRNGIAWVMVPEGWLGQTERRIHLLSIHVNLILFAGTESGRR